MTVVCEIKVEPSSIVIGWQFVQQGFLEISCVSICFCYYINEKSANIFVYIFRRIEAVTSFNFLLEA